MRLRALEESDAESEYYAITPDFDSESERMGDSISFPVSPEHMAGVIAEMSQHEPEGDEMWLVIENMDGEVVGNINTHSCNRRMGHFRYGIDIGYRWRGMGVWPRRRAADPQILFHRAALPQMYRWYLCVQ